MTYSKKEKLAAIRRAYVTLDAPIQAFYKTDEHGIKYKPEQCNGFLLSISIDDNPTSIGIFTFFKDTEYTKLRIRNPDRPAHELMSRDNYEYTFPHNRC
ncbi:MAG: hypothetical protein V1870_04240 [Candidatus Aenigmatarchaeota archaeon]